MRSSINGRREKRGKEDKNSDDDTDNRSEYILKLDDLYREDGSVIDFDVDEKTMTDYLEIIDETIARETRLSESSDRKDLTK